jgi:formylglycine-generating enzyme required for sulfatase activity
MGHKYFISYSRSVKEDVRKVIDLLKASGQEIWWDANLPKIADWWSTILDHIEWCEVCIFVVSEQSVQSPYCLEELRYASARKRPILFFIIDNLDPSDIPDEIKSTRSQWLTYDGNPATMLNDVLTSVEQLKWERYKDIPVSRPPEPNTGGTSLARQFQEAVELAEESKFDEAIKKFRNVGGLDYHKWGEDCHAWEIKIRSYGHILELADSKSTFKKAQREWNKYKEKYRNEDEIFDPSNLEANFNVHEFEKFADLLPSSGFPEAPTNAVEFSLLASVLSLPRRVETSLPKLSVSGILPQPFDWIEIPAGSVTLLSHENEAKYNYLKKDTVFEVPSFAIAKYPVTNAQFAEFIKQHGYRKNKWWTDVGWEARMTGVIWVPEIQRTMLTNEPWTAPRSWDGTNTWDDPKWNKPDHPVIGVTWYEAVAFCAWLADITDDFVFLPTEQQWQRAAQGDDSRIFPWGEWSENRCNAGIGRGSETTPVNKYEGLGDSPYGVVDMVGNVWQWCVNEWETGSEQTSGRLNSLRVVRGSPFSAFGAYGYELGPGDEVAVSVNRRIRLNAGFSSVDLGFRIARAL